MLEIWGEKAVGYMRRVRISLYKLCEQKYLIQYLTAGKNVLEESSIIGYYMIHQWTVSHNHKVYTLKMF